MQKRQPKGSEDLEIFFKKTLKFLTLDKILDCITEIYKIMNDVEIDILYVFLSGHSYLHFLLYVVLWKTGIQIINNGLMNEDPEEHIQL